MVKIIENITSNKADTVIRKIDRISKKLNSLKESIEYNPDSYDIEFLINILIQLYDDISEIEIVLN